MNNPDPLLCEAVAVIASLNWPKSSPVPRKACSDLEMLVWFSACNNAALLLPGFTVLPVLKVL